jgi:hypothetical protein
MNYQQRIALINKDADSRKVWDSIDRPIRPLVFELARIGMEPTFSCCGFSYPDEDLDEPKTHHSSRAYVFFRIKQNKLAEDNFIKLKALVQLKRWNLHIPFNDNIVELYCYDQVPADLYVKKDKIPESIHQYESHVIAIQNLTYSIQEGISTCCDPIVIIDGNKAYNETLPEWQVKAKQNFIISVSDYYKQYGRVKKFKLMTKTKVKNLEALRLLLPEEIETHSFRKSNSING